MTVTWLEGTEYLDKAAGLDRRIGGARLCDSRARPIALPSTTHADCVINDAEAAPEDPCQEDGLGTDGAMESMDRQIARDGGLRRRRVDRDGVCRDATSWRTPGRGAGASQTRTAIVQAPDLQD